MNLSVVLLVLFGYFAGAVPFGVLIARWLGVDIREHGSGNIGATNVTRVLGKLPGALVLVLDSTKGALPTWLAIRYSGDPTIVAVTGGMAILGHCFSPFLGFTGGKGVATALGVFLVIAPRAALIGMGAFAIMFALTRVPALGSLVGAAIIAAVLSVAGEPAFSTLAIATFALLVWTHRGNLQRLFTSAR